MDSNLYTMSIEIWSTFSRYLNQGIECENTTFIRLRASFVNKKTAVMVVVNRQKYLLFREEVEVKKRGCSIFTLQPLLSAYNVFLFFLAWTSLNESLCTHLMLLLCYCVTAPSYCLGKILAKVFTYIKHYCLGLK